MIVEERLLLIMSLLIGLFGSMHDGYFLVHIILLLVSLRRSQEGRKFCKWISQLNLGDG